MSKDYERGVEQASAVYKEVIREYVAENTKLRELALEAYDTACGLALNDPLADVSWLADHMREMGIEV